MSEQTQPISTDTFSLAKGINHLQNAINYFVYVRDSIPNDARGKNGRKFMNEILNGLNKANFAFIRKVKTADAKDALRDELANSATLDSLMNIVIALPDAIREQVEDFAQKALNIYEAYKRGEIIDAKDGATYEIILPNVVVPMHSENAGILTYGSCPEFPYFGASYPDARCIDGVLYDLDKCDENGNLYVPDQFYSCPFCQPQQAFKDHDTGFFEENAKIIKNMNLLRRKHGFDPVEITTYKLYSVHKRRSHLLGKNIVKLK